MPTPPFIPETLTNEGRDLIAEVWEAQAKPLPSGVIPPWPTPKERAEHAARDVGSAEIGSLVAHVCANRKEHTVSLLLDEHTAAVLVYAARLLCADYETHKQELLEAARQFPPDSYGYQNRKEQAWRRYRIARRLRAVEGAYRDVVDKELWGL